MKTRILIASTLVLALLAVAPGLRPGRRRVEGRYGLAAGTRAGPDHNR